MIDLKKWESPETPAALDRRVWASYRRIRRGRWIWVPVGIVAALILAMASWHPTGELDMDSEIISTSSAVTVETNLNVGGFLPLRDGKLVAAKEGE
jgi:hypothetical protein